MFTIENVLLQNEIEDLIKIIDYEITNHLFVEPGYPLYQSSAIMHIKYKENPIIGKLVSKMVAHCPRKNLFVRSLWFNVCKIDSAFQFHTHNSDMTAVYFVKECTNNGPLLKINNTDLQVLTVDNNLLFLESNIVHKIPEWAGKDRYSVAADLIEKF